VNANSAPQPEDLVVAVDGSPASNTALQWAAQHAKTTGASLHLATVMWIPEGSFSTETELRPVYERVLEDAEAVVRRTAPGAAVTSRIARGVPAATLVEASKTASLLIMGSDKSSRMEGLTYGTLPLRVAARSHCPLVVVPGSWTPLEGPVLLCVGENEQGHAPEAFAIQQATVRKAPLDLIHVWAASPIYPAQFSDTGLVYESMKESHRQVLSGAAEYIRSANPDLEVREILREGRRLPPLVEAGERSQLMVIGRHGTGILRELLMGATAHDVLLNPPCPVAVVPMAEAN
jgi:nucleotide-binding universal stress UspA family protein